MWQEKDIIEPSCLNHEPHATTRTIPQDFPSLSQAFLKPFSRPRPTKMMTDLGSYWTDWAVAEREHETRQLHTKSCKGCTWCVGAAPAAEPAAAPALSREAATDRWDGSPLVAAAATGDVDWVKELLAEGADVNEFSPGSYEYSSLIVAAQKGHVEIVRLLLQTGVCDLTKKHMEYINALDSALHGYCNLEGCEDEFTPEIRAMLIRAHVETADRIKLDMLLHIEASGAVMPEQIKAFRFGMGVRNKSVYSKAKPGKLNLNDPPAAKMQMVIAAANHAARRIAAEKAAADAAAAIAAGKAEKIKKPSGPSGAPSRVNAFGGAGCSSERIEGDDDESEHPMFKKKVTAYDPMLDDSYGKMSRRFNF